MVPKGLLLGYVGLVLVRAVSETSALYNVCIKTAKCRGAGTDADVRVRVLGPLATARWVTLNHPHRNDFEYNSRDCFHFRGVPVAKRIEDIRGVQVQQFRRGERWCVSYVSLTYRGGSRNFRYKGYRKFKLCSSNVYTFSSNGTEPRHPFGLLPALCVLLTAFRVGV